MSGQHSATPSPSRTPGLLERLYDRCMDWVRGPWGAGALFAIALAESSFFPLPPDVFLIALCLAAPRRSFRHALVCAVGSVLGGMLGYGLGLAFMDTVGMRIIDFYGLADKYGTVRDLYHQYDAWAVAVAGFTPLPYKLFTITAGAFRIDFPTFVLASALSRSARFLLVAGLIFLFGERVERFIRRYLNLLTVVFTLLLIGGFVAMKFLP